MGHNIHHSTYPENVNKKAVQAEWDEYAMHEDWQEGCSGLNADIRWIDYICQSYEEFHTGADGYYGHADKFKTPYGVLITLELDGDMFSYEDVINEMKYLFDAEEI